MVGFVLVVLGLFIAFSANPMLGLALTLVVAGAHAHLILALRGSARAFGQFVKQHVKQEG